MNIDNYIFDALEMVMTWDLPEDQLADAINQQARLMVRFGEVGDLFSGDRS